MSNNPVWFFALAAVGIAVAWYFQHRAHERRKQLALQVAAQAGLQVDVTKKDPPPYDFDLFGIGNGRRVDFHMWPQGTNDGVFRYQYTTGSGKNRSTHLFTCALIEIPFNAPHLEIGPEGFWSKIGKAVGIHDVEVESGEFNDVYRVSCADERFAITVLDQRMMAWMLSLQSGRGSVRFEFLRNALLCINEQIEIEEQPGFLQWSQRVREHLPAVLSELYPPSSRR